MAAQEFVRVNGNVMIPEKRQVDPVSLNPNSLLSTSGLGDNKTLMILKIYDKNGKLNLPENVRASQAMANGKKHIGTDLEPAIIISHDIMPENVKGTILSATFNHNQTVIETTIGALKSEGIKTGYYTTKDRLIESAPAKPCVSKEKTLVAA